MNREARDRALEEYFEMQKLWRSKGDQERGITGDEAKDQRDEAQIAYFDSLPLVYLSRCPFCRATLVGQFDPWGFDGFWWQEREMGLAKPPTACEHFRVLRGAVGPGEVPPVGGEYEAHLGPDVPYVIPAVLELPTMVAVISSFLMENGATAFPIAYFSTESPPPGSLAAPWRKTTYSFRTADGKGAWAVKKDPWDFELEPWIESGRLFWTNQTESELLLADPQGSRCPFLDLQGQRLPQIIKGDRLRFDALPNPADDADPFTS